MDIPNTGAIFTLGKSYLAENTQSYFYIKNDPVKRVISGPHQSAVICESGRLFVWGENHHGQLGIGGNNNNNNNNANNNNNTNTGKTGDIVTKPTCVKSLKTLGLKIADVAFGNDWAVMLTHSNELFFSGRNIFPTGTQVTQNFNTSHVEGEECAIIRKPFRLEEFDDCLSHSEEEENFVTLLAGNEHFAVMTSSGRLIGWGSNASHQLGFAGSKDEHAPLEIVLDAAIKQFTCGPESTLVLTESGNLYLTGKLNDLVFPHFTVLQKNLSPSEQIIFMHISKASEIYIVTNAGVIYRSFEAVRNKHLIFQRFYDYDSEENGPIWKLLRGFSFYTVLTKANKFYTTFSESGHHLKTFREISKFKNLRLLDMAVGDQHILVHGIPRSSTLSATVGASGEHRYMSRTFVMPDINGNVSRARSGNSSAVLNENILEEEPETIGEEVLKKADDIEKAEIKMVTPKASTPMHENGEMKAKTIEALSSAHQIEENAQTLEKKKDENDIDEQYAADKQPTADTVEKINESIVENLTILAKTNKEVTKRVKSAEKVTTTTAKESPTQSIKSAGTEFAKESARNSIEKSPTESAKETPTTSIKKSPTESAKESPTTTIKKSPTESPTNSIKESSSASSKEPPIKSINKSPTESAKESPTISSKNSPTESVKSRKSTRSIKFAEQALKNYSSPSEKPTRPRTPYPDSSSASTPPTTKKAIRNFSYEAAMEHDAIDKTTPMLHDSMENITDDIEPENAFNATINNPTPPFEEDEELTLEIETITDELDQTVINEIRFINNGVDVTPSVEHKMQAMKMDSIENDLETVSEEEVNKSSAALQEVNEKQSEKVDAAVELKNEVKEEIKESTEAVGVKVDTKFQQAKGSIESVAQKVATGARDAVDIVGANAKKAATGARDAVNTVGVNAKNAANEAGDAMGSLGHKAMDAASEAGDAIGAMGHRAMDAASDAKHAMGNAMAKAADNTKNAMDSMTSKISHQLHDAKENITSLVSSSTSKTTKEKSPNTSAQDNELDLPSENTAKDVPKTSVGEDDERTTASINSNQTSSGNPFDGGNPFEGPNPFDNDLPDLGAPPAQTHHSGKQALNEELQHETEKSKSKMRQFFSDMRSKGKGMSCRSEKSIRIEDEPPRYTPVESLSQHNRIEHVNNMNNSNGHNSNTSKVCTIL